MSDEPEIRSASESPQSRDDAPASADAPPTSTAPMMPGGVGPTNYVELLRAHSLKLLLAGAALVALAFVSAWWSLATYRVSEYRGVDRASSAEMDAVTKELSAEEREELKNEETKYANAWIANDQLHRVFYEKVDDEYSANLKSQDAVTKNGGSIALRGWSTWTGWFGLIFVIAGIVLYALPKLVEAWEPWAWAVPWAWVAMGGLYVLLACAFYFGIPDRNGDGYSQGASLGNYLAMLGGLAVVVGGIFEALKAADERLARLENEPDDDAEEEEAAEEEADDDEPLDEEAERRRRLNDW